MTGFQKEKSDGWGILIHLQAQQTTWKFKEWVWQPFFSVTERKTSGAPNESGRGQEGCQQVGRKHPWMESGRQRKTMVGGVSAQRLHADEEERVSKKGS